MESTVTQLYQLCLRTADLLDFTSIVLLVFLPGVAYGTVSTHFTALAVEHCPIY